MVEAQLQSSLALFELSKAELESAGDAADVTTCARAFVHDVQKISLLTIHGELPPWDSKDGQEIVKQLVGLCYALARQCALRSAGGCKAWRAATRDAFQAVIEASCAFFQLVGGESRPKKEFVVAATAAVMEKCKLLETMPKDNRTATSRALVRLGAAIKDVVRELGDMKPTEAKADAQEAAEGACDEEEEDEDDFMYNPEFDEAEARVAAHAVPMANAALQLLKPVMRALLDAPEPSGEDEQGLARLDALCTVYKQIALASEEVGASLYPPQEIESLRAHCSALASGAAALGQLVGEMPGLGEETRAAVQQGVDEVYRAKEVFAAALTGSCAEAA